MDLGIKGKTAMITACSSGLGQSIAQRLAMEGCNLTLLSRSAEKLESLARELRSKYGNPRKTRRTRYFNFEHRTPTTKNDHGLG